MINEKEIYNLTFLGLEGKEDESKAILTRVSEIEQTLEVSAGPGARPYYIIGRRVGDDSVFVGKRHGMKGDSHVVVRWINDEGTIMGLWVEDNTVYGFSGFKDQELLGSAIG